MRGDSWGVCLAWLLAMAKSKGDGDKFWKNSVEARREMLVMSLIVELPAAQLFFLF